ncbi:MAG: serine/threonine protein kinase [Akkermansiaceae bacterium]|nr:serine/threonine protein kinase [Akkermansiaceae bacterium]MCP5544384.1 serine/threonine protein kinase [Akkermansiaceae bacterium]MCP5547454.1 serine/threonine protein kinase [Akkermansiaceae bacterium]
MLEIQSDADEFFELHPEVGGDETAEESEPDVGVDARIGPYRLIDRIGSGGCGVVYLAEQRAPVNRKVALKIIRIGMDTEAVIARFSLEREALALMDHPNIARVLDAGTTASGRPYFVMELVDGEKITDFCDRCRLALRQRLEMFVLVCEAIQHAHQKGVIHRDIKPSNVIVREVDGKPVPKVIDFGIAKATAAEIETAATVTKSGQLVGTPAYMSPEQASGGADIDTRSDIYSLGVLLYELLTGSTPVKPEQLRNQGPEEILHILLDEDTGMPSVRLREIPDDEIGEIAGQRATDPKRLPSQLAGDLDWIVMKSIEKDRVRRYDTADGLAMDVRRYLAGQPVLARPPSRAYLFSKLVRRNRALFAAAAVALTGLLGGLGVSTWLFLRERDARQQQTKLRAEAERARANEVVLREFAEAGDVVAQAAVLLRYKEMEQSDEMIDKLRAERLPLTLETANTLMSLANWNLTEGRWDKAVRRFKLLALVLTSVDMTDSDRVSHDLLPTLTAVCEWGGPGQYETLRSLAIDRFADTANAVVAEQVIKATMLKPTDQRTLQRLLPAAAVIEAAADRQNGNQDPHMAAWRCFSLALLRYRTGDLDAAEHWVGRSLSTAKNSSSREISNHLVLALVEARRGNPAAARNLLEDAREHVSRWEEKPFRINTSDGVLWSNWGINRILLREAEAVLGNLVD